MSLEVVREPGAMRALAEDRRRDGRKLALVPTMGFLHEGHLSLIRAARARADVVMTSIFVNPTQFGPGEDLDRYPRDEAGDLKKAEESGTDIVFCPDVAGMYPEDTETRVVVGALAEPLCGASRPGHFEGVTTVVTKLFHLTMPHLAVFGQKDFQQLAIIRRMVLDLDFGIEIVGMPIVRESDGLAMSSRNAYLSPEERRQAVRLSRGLEAARERYRTGERGADELVAAAREVIAGADLGRIDYLELRDAKTLGAIDRVEREAVLACAVFFGSTRLIDNAVLG